MLNRPLILLAPDSAAGIAEPPKAAATPAPAPVAAKPAQAPTAAEPISKEQSEADAEYDKAFGKTIAPAKPAEKPAEKAPEKKPEAKVEPEKPVPTKEPTGPKELREHLAAVKAERDTFKTKADALEAKIAEVEKKGGDTAKLTERLTELETAHKEAVEELRLLREEPTDEFKAKYVQPFKEAAEEARDWFVQLQVLTPEGMTRQADWDKDFAPIYNLNWTEAHARAKELFPDTHDFVIRKYDELHRLAKSRDKAMEADLKARPDRIKARDLQTQQQQEAVKAAWPKVNESIRAKDPAFQPVDGDDEGNAALDKGFSEFDAGYNNNQQTFTQKMVWTATMRHRAAAYPRMKTQLTAKDAKIAELQDQIEQLKSSEPTDVRKSGSEKPAESKGPWNDLKEGKDY